MSTDKKESSYIKAVSSLASSVESLDRGDVFQLLEAYGDCIKEKAGLAKYIAENRPELKGELRECIATLKDSSLYCV